MTKGEGKRDGLRPHSRMRGDERLAIRIRCPGSNSQSPIPPQTTGFVDGDGVWQGGWISPGKPLRNASIIHTRQ